MIEAQGQLSLGRWHKLFRLLAPRRRFLSRAETEQQRLIGQRNRRSPIESECAEIGDGRDSARSLFACQPSTACEIDEIAILLRKVGQRSLVRVPDNWDHDALTRFDGEADIDRFRTDCASADQT